MIRIKHKFTGKVLISVKAASLEGIDLPGVCLRGAALSGADLSGADLRGADLRRAELGSPGWTLGKEIAWIGLIWLFVGLLNSQVLQWLMPLPYPIIWFYIVTFLCLYRCFQAHDRWRRALWFPLNLRGANLQRANLSGAALSGAKLTGARYDGTTRWPAGFDPEQHGAVADRPPPMSQAMAPHELLERGQEILDPLMEPAGFSFELTQGGQGMGDPVTVGCYTNGEWSLELHVRWGLGRVIYRIGEAALEHRAYMECLGGSQEAAYPGSSADPLDAFRHLRADLERFGGAFLRREEPEAFQEYVCRVAKAPQLPGSLLSEGSTEE